MSLSLQTTILPRTRRGKFPKLPKLNREKKLALILGFIVWYVFGVLLKGKYHPVLAFSVGFLLSYGPLIARILISQYIKRLILKGRPHEHMLIAVAVQTASMGVCYLLIGYINTLMFPSGFTLTSIIFLSVSLYLVPWNIMPNLWFKKDTQPPAAT